MTEEFPGLGMPWFIPRMMHDTWSFGLLLDNGLIMCITHISDIKEVYGQQYVDVEMDTSIPAEALHLKRIDSSRFLIAPTERTTASVRLASIVAAFDLAST